MKLEKFIVSTLVPVALSSFSVTAGAFTFQMGAIEGSLDSTVSVGTAIRMESPSCGLVLQGASGSGAPSGCVDPNSYSLGDQGNLNYKKGNPFTTYLKGNHELLLKEREYDLSFMARGTWVQDYASTHTSGYITSSPGAPAEAINGLTPEDRRDLRSKTRLLDFWVSKGFTINDEAARIRLGRQVISWGESLFMQGGINSTNAFDIMKLMTPGTQLKEAILPSSMVSFATGLGGGFNLETYYQFKWDKHYTPPLGSYWSPAFANPPYEASARDKGQWGVALKYQPQDTPLNVGVYAMNYHDKMGNVSFNVRNTGQLGLDYLEDRKLYGISVNFPLGDWAIGSELSYRPRDAVALNTSYTAPEAMCTGHNGNCWVDEARYQWHLTGIYMAKPGDTILKLLKADSATFLSEFALISYPGLKKIYNGDIIASGGWAWGQENNALNAPQAVGTKNSYAISLDYSWTYDGTLISGWQVTPEIFYYQGLKGRTPNYIGNFMEGAKSANFIVTFTQNPATWQFAINYGYFSGGSSAYDQPYKDRDFLGLNASFNF